MASSASAASAAASAIQIVGKRVGENSAFFYAATGDGTTNDATAYAAAEAANDALFLPADSIFNINAAVPAKPVYGPGAVKFGGLTYGGAQLAYDPYLTKLRFTPDSYYRKTSLFPPGDSHLVTVLSPGGPPAAAKLNRTTIVGNGNAMLAVELNRVDIFGDGAGRHLRFGERLTLLGTIAGEWFAAPDWSDHLLVAPDGSLRPDFTYLETENPGIAAKIAAFALSNPFATVTTDVQRIVAVGRDTFNAAIKGANSVAVGYSAGGTHLNPNAMTLVGSQANAYGLLTSEATAVGFAASQLQNEGTRWLSAGRSAMGSARRGDRYVALGSYAGNNFFELHDSLLLGYGAAGASGLTTATGVFFVGGSTGAPLMSGNFGGGTYTGPRVGVNVGPEYLRATLHVVTSKWGTDEAASASGDEAVFEGGANTGITIRAPAANSSCLVFARPGSSFVGGLIYAHATDTLTFQLNAAARATLGATGILNLLGTTGRLHINSLQVVGPRKTGWATATGTATRTTFDTTTVTTAQLAERFKALIDDFHATAGHGLLAA